MQYTPPTTDTISVTLHTPVSSKNTEERQFSYFVRERGRPPYQIHYKKGGHDAYIYIPNTKM